jgi:hypothetical protein
MQNVWFFVKTFLITLLIVTLLQVRISGRTLEQRTVDLASHSLVVEPFQVLANSTVLGFHRVWDQITEKLRAHRSHPGARATAFKLERHPDVLKKEASDSNEAAQ